MKIILNALINDLPTQASPIINYHNYLLNILVNIGYDINTAPVADLLKNLHGLDGDWLVVSPINWQATHNDSMLVTASYDFSLNTQQSNFLFKNFSAFVEDEGMQLYMHDAYTWLLKTNGKPKPKAKPVYSILHHSLMSELQNLDESLYWQKFITMSQMLFNNLKIPDDTNLYPINGVWVWGGGKLIDNPSLQLVALDDEALNMAKILSKNTCLYDSSLTIKKDTILQYKLFAVEKLWKLIKKLKQDSQ